MTLHEKDFEKKWNHRTLPGVPRVPILGPHHGIFSKLNWPGPLSFGSHSQTSFSTGRFHGE